MLVTVVNRIATKAMDGFELNFQRRSETAKGKTDFILAMIQITIETKECFVRDSSLL